MFYITICKWTDGALSASDPGDFDAAVDAYAEHMDRMQPENMHWTDYRVTDFREPGATVYRCEPETGAMADVTKDAKARVWDRYRQRGWMDSLPAWLADEVAA